MGRNMPETCWDIWQTGNKKYCNVTSCWYLFITWSMMHGTQNIKCFGEFLFPLSGVIHCTLSNGICHTDSFRAGYCSKAVYKHGWHIQLLCVQWITADDGQRNCPKHVKFHFQNKFEKLVYLVGFIIRRFVMMHVHVYVKVYCCLATGIDVGNKLTCGTQRFLSERAVSTVYCWKMFVLQFSHSALRVNRSNCTQFHEM
jgi:hypothetical protein